VNEIQRSTQQSRLARSVGAQQSGDPFLGNLEIDSYDPSGRPIGNRQIDRRKSCATSDHVNRLVDLEGLT